MEILLLTDLSSLIFSPFGLELQTAFILADKTGLESALALRLTGST